MLSEWDILFRDTPSRTCPPDMVATFEVRIQETQTDWDVLLVGSMDELTPIKVGWIRPISR